MAFILAWGEGYFCGRDEPMVRGKGARLLWHGQATEEREDFITRSQRSEDFGSLKREGTGKVRVGKGVRRSIMLTIALQLCTMLSWATARLIITHFTSYDVSRLGLLHTRIGMRIGSKVRMVSILRFHVYQQTRNITRILVDKAYENPPTLRHRSNQPSIAHRRSRTYDPVSDSSLYQRQSGHAYPRHLFSLHWNIHTPTLVNFLSQNMQRTIVPSASVMCSHS